MEEFLKLRKWFFGELDKILHSAAGECHKSYEGTFELTFYFPCIFEEDKEPEVRIHLDCYLVGPCRHYDWTGKTMKEAIQKCRNDLEELVKEALEED